MPVLQLFRGVCPRLLPIGGTSCEGCGLWFCDFYLDENGYCGKCAAKYEVEDEEIEGEE